MRSVGVPAACATRFGRDVALQYPEGLMDWFRAWRVPGLWHVDGLGRTCRLEVHEVIR